MSKFLFSFLLFATFSPQISLQTTTMDLASSLRLDVPKFLKSFLHFSIFFLTNWFQNYMSQVQYFSFLPNCIPPFHQCKSVLFHLQNESLLLNSWLKRRMSIPNFWDRVCIYLKIKSNQKNKINWCKHPDNGHHMINKYLLKKLTLPWTK